jgi:hypothetical protein
MNGLGRPAIKRGEKHRGSDMNIVGIIPHLLGSFYYSDEVLWLYIPVLVTATVLQTRAIKQKRWITAMAWVLAVIGIYTIGVIGLWPVSQPGDSEGSRILGIVLAGLEVLCLLGIGVLAASLAWPSGHRPLKQIFG